MPRLSIEAEPAALTVDTESAALIIIDMQRDFLEPGGFGETLGNDVSLLQRRSRALQGACSTPRARPACWSSTPARATGPICPTRRRAKIERGAPSKRIGDTGPMGRILVRGEPGHDIIAELYPIAGEPVIDKPGKGAFYATDLELMLRNRGIDTLVVCGVTTEVCVNTTVREANDRGYRCIVLGDCCASYFPEFHEMGLKMIKAQGGIFGWVSDSKAMLAALAADRDAKRARKGIRATGGTSWSCTCDDAANRHCGRRATGTRFFGFGTNILVNLLTLTGLLRFVLKMPDDLVFGRILPGAGPDDVPVHVLLRLARLSAGEEDRPQRRLRAALGHQRAAHVHRHLRDHAADRAQDQRPDQGLGSRTDLGVHPELHPDGRRLHRADRAQDHAARRPARHAGRRLHRLHLDEAGAARCI